MAQQQNDSYDHVPIPTDSFFSSAIWLKNKVVEATWKADKSNVEIIDPTAYTGLLGTAFVCLRSYEATGDLDDLRLSSEIVDKCAGSLGTTKYSRNVTFLCGCTGVYALGAVVAHLLDDQPKKNSFLDFFIQVAQDHTLSAGAEEGGFGISYELLNGRAGFLYSALFINKYLGPNTVPSSLLKPIINAIITGGRAGAGYGAKDCCPLMYRWHGTRFFGAACGLAGILHVLLHLPLELEEEKDVEDGVWYLVRSRLQGGNYPSSQNNCRDTLVQWSHGAGGVAIMLCKAAQVYAEQKDRPGSSQTALNIHDTAVEAGEVVWRRGMINNNKISLADGIGGNAYAFLSLYRLTADRTYLTRAEAFATEIHRRIKKMVCDDVEELDVFSLFYGLAGVACLFFDVADPESSRFPGFEV